MKRNLLILFVIFITILPYAYVWYTFNDWPVVYRYVWMFLGVTWALWIMDVKKHGYFRSAFVYAINLFAWPSCLAIWAYCKLILKRDTLFQSEVSKDEQTPT